MKPTLEETEALVLRYISQAHTSFDDVLSAVVAYQRAWIPALAQFWARRGHHEEGAPPATVPAVPTDVFKHVSLVSTERPPTRTFRTSGTTSGTRGTTPRISTSAYDRGAVRHAESCLGSLRDFRVIPLVFSPRAVPDSSLSHMVSLFVERSVDPDVPYLLGTEGLAIEAFDELLEALPARHPCLVFGTAIAFGEWLKDSSLGRTLPRGSLVVETGGYKGLTRTLAREDLYTQLAERLGVAIQDVRSEYSMTELSSQLYSRPWTAAGDQEFVPPHWCRVQAVDPVTLTPLPVERRGILRFVDLANVDTPVAVQTSDLGRVLESGHVVLEGRRLGSTPRGCSLAAEEVLHIAARRRGGEL